MKMTGLLVVPWLRVVPLSLSLLCVTWKKTKKKYGRVKSWGREARERLRKVASFSTPGFYAASLFFAVFFRVTLNRLSERETTRSLCRTLIGVRKAVLVPNGVFSLKTRPQQELLWYLKAGAIIRDGPWLWLLVEYDHCSVCHACPGPLTKNFAPLYIYIYIYIY